MFIAGVGRRESNRSKFVAEAVRRELDRRQAELRRSQENPHPESAGLSEPGVEQWPRRQPEEDAQTLAGDSAGKVVR
jgi:hypothetical protein